MVKPPSILKFSPRLAVSVAISIVNAIKEAETLVNKQGTNKIPPINSDHFARKAMKTGKGKCNSSPNHFLKNNLSSGEDIILKTELPFLIIT
jgi:hypothetical protein